LFQAISHLSKFPTIRNFVKFQTEIFVENLSIHIFNRTRCHRKKGTWNHRL